MSCSCNGYHPEFSSESLTKSPRIALCDDWHVADSIGAEDTPIAFDLHRRAHRFRIVVGKLDGRFPIRLGDFANQTDRIESVAAGRIASSKIVGEESVPAGS